VSRRADAGTKGALFFVPCRIGPALRSRDVHRPARCPADCRRDSSRPAAHARLFFSYGPFEQPQRLVPSIIRALLKGEPARLTSGAQVRDFLDVRDLGRCLALLLASKVEGAVNIASGTGVSVARIAGLLGDMIGRPDLLQFGAVALPRVEPPSIVADISRLVTEVGAKPEITLEQGLSNAVAWWRERT